MFEQSIDPELIDILGKISQKRDFVESFYLAGGTALALHLGHRKSVDLDFFSEKEFNTDYFCRFLTAIGGRIAAEEQSTIQAFVDQVKISLFYYPYRVLEEYSEIRGIKVAGIQDIACMKVIAIAQRAEKKDFFDLYEILRTTAPTDLKRMILEKYGPGRINCYHVLKALFYFADAENSPDPISLNHTCWEEVKRYFLDHERKIKESLCPEV
ncbi:MAG: nucleotidyl transferase AbiEii/AbiGii toxin family protein [Candidatus Wallbacteria bacterium]|nr:nucleotidyl transferase AbiEii/AbiGii toxin family protein [Candidatus Wallbacteria bacterium]